MGYRIRWLLFAAVIAGCLVNVLPAGGEPVNLDSSTQFLWGDDLMGESQAILAQYLRLSFKPEEKSFSITGYGRVWEDFTDNDDLREDDFLGRLYYLYLDYSPFKDVSLRLGRQYAYFTSGSSIVDGLSVNVDRLGPVGLTLAGGRDVQYSLDSEFSRSGNYFWAADLHLINIKQVRFGVSYAMKYDESDRARQELGLNFRFLNQMASPYAEVRYDWLSKTVDEMTLGVDTFPLTNLLVRLEYYQSYPTFDSTSIYSVFAVDLYREYLIRTEYSLNSFASVYASYVREAYEDDSNANVYLLGTRLVPVDDLAVNAAVDRREGYGGNIWGFEVYGNYRVKKKFNLAAGIQYDIYRRPNNSLEQAEGDNQYATRYWLGGEWSIKKNLSVNARIEDNVNENFNNRILGRVLLNWSL